jgi:hypothetical protein
VYGLYLVVSSVVLFVFLMKPPGINGNWRATVPDMIAGTAHRPFVYRQLVPLAVRAANRATPQPIREAVAAVAREPKRQELLSYLKWEREHLFDYVVIAAILMSCFLGFALAMRSLIGNVYHVSPAVRDMAPVPALILLPVFFRSFPAIYDPSALLLFAWALALMAKERLGSYYPVFALACLNKETSLLLVPLFVLRELGKRMPGFVFGHAALQTSIWGLFRSVLTERFRRNPGLTFEFHLLDHNLVLYREPVYLLYFLAVFGSFWLLIRRGWAGAPRLLRRSFLLTFGVLFVATLLFGYVDEARDYLEAYPLAFLIMLPGILELLGSRFSADGAQHSSPSQASSMPSVSKLGPR